VKHRENQNGGLLVTERLTSLNMGAVEEFPVAGETAVDHVDSHKEPWCIGEVYSQMTFRRCADESTQTMSQYEIPLDVQWEFPRDR